VSEAPQIRRFDEPDERRPLELGQVDLIRLGELTFDRATFEPGWRWSQHARAGASCPERHLGYVISGRMFFLMDDGTRCEASAGDLYLIPPGHDAWVVGDEPCVVVDLAWSS
jgi:quercetin dioxygenase-like cupin family protein